MYLFHLVFVSWLLVLVKGDGNGVNITEVASEIPSCATGCFAAALTSSPTLLTDLPTTCNNATLLQSLVICVSTSCTLPDQIAITTVTQGLCKDFEHDSRVLSVALTGYVCGPLIIVALLLRCYARYSLPDGLGADDWCSVAAVTVGVAALIEIVYSALGLGLGKHIWDVDPANVTNIFKFNYVSELLYHLSSNLVKISILLFYLRVFFVTRWLVITVYVYIAVVASCGTGLVLAGIFQCTPIDGVWTRSPNAKCINFNKVVIAGGVFSVVFDFLILSLPIPQLLGLKMSARKKFSLVIVFSVGSLACATSIVRLYFVGHYASSPDPTWENVPGVVWSVIEIAVAIICSCLPAIRTILARLLPSLFDITNSDPSSQPSSTSTALHSSNPFPFPTKIGPMFNRRAPVKTADDESLTQTPTFSSSLFLNKKGVTMGMAGERKIWIRPRFEEQGFKVESLRAERVGGEGNGGNGGSGNSKEKKIWISPRFDDDGRVELFSTPSPSVPKQLVRNTLSAIESDLERELRRNSEEERQSRKSGISGKTEEEASEVSSETSLWVVEGPRVSDEISSAKSPRGRKGRKGKEKRRGGDWSANRLDSGSASLFDSITRDSTITTTAATEIPFEEVGDEMVEEEVVEDDDGEESVVMKATIGLAIGSPKRRKSLVEGVVGSVRLHGIWASKKLPPLPKTVRQRPGWL